jgi:hypothetical protein
VIDETPVETLMVKVFEDSDPERDAAPELDDSFQTVTE